MVLIEKSISLLWMVFVLALYNRAMLEQRTIKTLTRAVGMGLHSGQRVEMTLRPAPPDTGIVFRRVDLPEPVDIPDFSRKRWSIPRMASTIGAAGAKVHTVEHLMSALCGLGIDNIVIDITAEEVPILDGALLFLCISIAKCPVLNYKK